MLKNNLDKWFFGFWVNNIRVSFLLIFLILFAWIFSVYSIPKESSPDVKFGIINISVSYPWVNPIDMDNLITQKIETEIKDIEWIKKISSASSVWFTSITVELDTWVDTRILLTDIKDKVDNLTLPSDAKEPNVTEISTNSSLMYEVLLYWDNKEFDSFTLTQKAILLKNKLEWKYGISNIDIWSAWDMRMWSKSSWQDDYQIKVLLDKSKIELLWLSINNISTLIKINNKDTPIWNFSVWELNYDFRFEWELSDINELKNITIRDNWITQVKLSDIADFSFEYPSKEIRKIWGFNKNTLNYISLSFNKSKWLSIFKASKDSKTELEKIINNNSLFEWLKVSYSKDMGVNILEDYEKLSNTAISTVILVFLTIIFFVWLREWIIAIILIPLSFLITFIVLNFLWLSLNFLTNFSLVLTLWIAIDTVIVIIEWASEKMKLWYSRRNSILIAVRDFKSPLISWTLTTLCAFLPLMFLPWVIWKFLSFIPITVFSTLLAALVLSLTLSSALFLVLTKSKKDYHIDLRVEKNLRDSDRELLEIDRLNKISRNREVYTFREKLLEKLSIFYEKSLALILSSSVFKYIFVFAPIWLLILSFIFLSPKIWFVLFPSSDNWVLNISVDWKTWLNEEYMSKYLTYIDQSLSKVEEVKVYYTTVSKNNIGVYIDLLDKKYRSENWLKNIFEVEELINEKLSILKSQWLDVSVSAQKWWPPTWSAIWIKLVSDSASKFDTLKKVSDDFEDYLKSLKWTKNVISTSSDSPWQFVFTFNNDKLSNIWLNQNDIISELYFYTNWIKSWSIKSEYEDNEIVVLLKDFQDSLTPENIENLIINTKVWNIRVWDFVKYEFKKSVDLITREKWNIVISVWSEVEKWFLPTDIQPLLDKFALQYNFPDWIYFVKSWESQENMDLIISTFISLFISIFLIFSILVLQFNSFKQPIIILYSIVLALLWVNVWLYLTWNPYSMPFGIWFVALTWVVVNDAIILIDKMNRSLINIEKNNDLNINYLEMIIISWKTRLQPIIVTTLTTIFWVLPLAMQDEFWAWLWYTIIFWLMVWSFMTLYVIPILYYWFVIRKKVNKKLKV